MLIVQSSSILSILKKVESISDWVLTFGLTLLYIYFFSIIHWNWCFYLTSTWCIFNLYGGSLKHSISLLLLQNPTVYLNVEPIMASCLESLPSPALSCITVVRGDCTGRKPRLSIKWRHENLALALVFSVCLFFFCFYVHFQIISSNETRILQTELKTSWNEPWSEVNIENQMATQQCLGVSCVVLVHL